MRQLIGQVLASVAYTGARGRNGYSYEWAQLTFNPATNDCCISISTPAYRNILVGNNEVRTWYDALEVRIDRRDDDARVVQLVPHGGDWAQRIAALDGD